jgi:hypothetical protein
MHMYANKCMQIYIHHMHIALYIHCIIHICMHIHMYVHRRIYHCYIYLCIKLEMSTLGILIRCEINAIIRFGTKFGGHTQYHSKVDNLLSEEDWAKVYVFGEDCKLSALIIFFHQSHTRSTGFSDQQNLNPGKIVHRWIDFNE